MLYNEIELPFTRLSSEPIGCIESATHGANQKHTHRLRIVDKHFGIHKKLNYRSSAEPIQMNTECDFSECLQFIVT